jgi:hypothetical protein
VLAVRDGARWPVMGSRYARADAQPRQAQTTPADPQLWDAIDRGEDPTRD